MFKRIGHYIAFGALGLYLLFNIALTQTVSPLYFSLIQDEKAHLVSFLSAIRSLPLFQSKLLLYKNLYGKTVEEQVYAEDKRKNELIHKLEQILKKNPSARDILYSLYLLHSDRENINVANVYLKKAQEIDPVIR